MRSEYTEVNSNRTNTTISPTGEKTVTVDSNEPLSYKDVVAGPMIHGDHKAPNPWGYALTERHLASGYYEVWSGGWVTRSTGPIFNNNLDAAKLSLPTSPLSKAMLECDKKLVEKIRGSLDLSVDLGELHSTKRMLDITGGLSNSLEGLMTRKVGLAKRLVRETSGRYLEWRYGWMPILSDLYEAADESLRYVLNNVQEVNVAATIPYPSSSVKKGFALGGMTPWAQTLQLDGKAGCKLKMRFNVENRIRADRWASLNPVSIAYELTPYSFVADWFFNVGSYLRNLETFVLYKDDFIGGERSTIDACFVKAEIERKQGSTGDRIAVKGSANARIISFNRSILTTYPVPRMPIWDLRMGSSRLLSAAALLAQFLDYNPPWKAKSRPRRQSERGQGISYWEKKTSNLLLKHGLVK